MDKAELVQNLENYGRRLTTQSVESGDMAKGIGFALLALSELMRGTPDDVSSDTAPESFKAKANRW